MNRRARRRQTVLRLTLSSLAILLLFPIAVTVIYSFFSPGEIRTFMATRNDYTSGSFMEVRLIPRVFSLDQYYQVLISDREILRYFCNSAIYALAILTGQLLILPAMAYGLSCFRFRGRNILSFGIVLLMVLPFQVTMAPSVLILRDMGLLNTAWAIILPMTAAPFSVFLLRQYMLSIPVEVLQAAQIDSAGPFHCFVSIALPMSKPVIGAMIALSFAECWNLVEQPLVYLTQRPDLYPLSVVFGRLSRNITGTEFAGAVLYILPALLVFWIFQDDIMEGIQGIDLR